MSQTRTKRRVTPLRIYGVAALSLLALLWFVTQSGQAPRPGAIGAMVSIVAGSLPVLAAVWFCALGYGLVIRAVLLPGRSVGLTAAMGIGIAGLLFDVWVLAWLGWLNAVTGWGLCLLGAAIALVMLWRDDWNEPKQLVNRLKTVDTWAVLLLVPGFVLLMVAACCPPGTLWRVEAFGYDVTSYHLQLPREWLAAGRMTGLEHNVYSFLPSLIEGGYLLIGTMRGSVVGSVYVCQLFHATLALLAAAAIGKTVAHRAGANAGIGAAAVFLAVPWVTITGSMAYNEMGVLALGATALLIAFSDAGTTRCGAVVIGFLVGAATLAKLTAGVMVAVPVGLILLFGLHRARSPLTANLQLALIAAAVGALTLSPYLLRNGLETGNPVFPFAADTLGSGHWNEELVQRWDTAHGLSHAHEGKLDSLGRQWLFNTGYGAVGGRATPRETQNIARFDREGGVPALWLAVVAASVLILIRKDTRRLGGALLLMLGLQVGFWLFATHLQSRFLLPTLLPACLIAGLGYDRFRTLTQPKAPTVAPLLGSALLVTLAVTGYVTLTSQTQTISDPATGQPLQLPVWTAIDAPMDNAKHPINRLPADSKTLMVADNSGLLYLSRPIVYASAFDKAPLGKVIRQANGDPDKVNALLRDRGVTHVWVHWSELDRLHATYGHDRDVTRESLARLATTGWRPVETLGRTATLYVLPKQDFTAENAKDAEAGSGP